jgi:fructose-bisphosphate aldolase, class II
VNPAREGPTMNPATQWLQAARIEGYAIPAFNAVNLETAQAIVQAAELERAPVIVQISENAARYAGMGLLSVIGRELRAQASVPVILHFDHAETLAVAKSAFDHGFDMVMLEGGDLELDAQIDQLRVLSTIAHAQNAAVEAEYEVVSKGDRQGTHAAIDDLATFAQATGCDALAVAIGSAHKQTDKTSALDLQRLEEIALVTPLPLVLHGASGVREDDLRQAIRLGIAKVNVATELALVFTKAVRKALEDPKSNDPRKYLGAGRDAMTERARAVIRLLGANGKAGT